MLRTVIPIALVVVLASCSDLLFWQKPEPDNYFQAIRLELGDSVLVFNLAAKQEIKTDAISTYHWFSANQVNITQGGYSGSLLDGSYEVYYEAGILKSKGDFELGRREGEWLEWHKNQKLAAKHNYRAGLKHGNFEIYDSRGVVINKGSYFNGQLNGKVSTGAGEAATTFVYKKGVVSDTLEVSQK